ncbi:hypothetical protein FHR24_001800 [Wenyingzhuangia heitensis]|uniref:Uncharacterized protein n=1 Tax=Wenyingzhuangia heitensis TaxID=1487859 RepID=A0ABX0UE55_9FLAO|nr:hypothetical protein [Wenyingzhuangia heitensis]NIJ45332.1 hypothetical protein [Wenyingzhuangia heitensis]
MKNILKKTIFFCFAILLSSCSKESIFEGTPNIELTKTYSLSNLTGNSLEKINIYQTESIVIEYLTDTKLNKYTTKNYTDNSTETVYDVTLVKLVPETQEDGSIINQEITWVLDGDKTSGTGTLIINDGVNPATTYTAITISEEEVYN